MKMMTLISTLLLVFFVSYPIEASETWGIETDIRNEQLKLRALKDELETNKMDLERLEKLVDSLTEKGTPFADIAALRSDKKRLEWEIEEATRQGRGNTVWIQKKKEKMTAIEERIREREKDLNQWMKNKSRAGDPVTFTDTLESVISFRTYRNLLRFVNEYKKMINKELPRKIEQTEKNIRELKNELEYARKEMIPGRLSYRGRINSQFESLMWRYMQDRLHAYLGYPVSGHFSAENMTMQIMPAQRKVDIYPVTFKIHTLTAPNRIRLRYTFSEGQCSASAYIKGTWESTMYWERKDYSGKKDYVIEQKETNSSGTWIGKPGPDLRYYRLYLYPSKRELPMYELRRIQ